MSVENICKTPLPISTLDPISKLLLPLTPLITANLCAPEGEGNRCLRNKDTIESETATVTTKVSTTSKDLHDTSRNSDSGKSSSCSPTLLDCSFDSGIAGVLLDSNDMQRHKHIQLCQRILLALERDREHFCAIRNRLSKISERKKQIIVETEHLCNVCCTEIDPENANTYVKCSICQKYICRSIKCADWLSKTAQWECELCQTSKESLAQTSSWVADQLSFNQQKLVYPMRARSEIFIPISECNDSSIHFESVSQIGANTPLITAEQRLKIREYVEEIVSNLLGGSLDTTSVNQLSKSENYLYLFYKYHSKLSNIFISMENAFTFHTLHRGDLPTPKTNGHRQHFLENGSIVTRRNENGNIPNATYSRESTPGPDFTDVSEARLRNMIQKIIAETVNMAPLTAKSYAVSEIALDRPSKLTEGLGVPSNGLRHRTEHYFEPTIYQDLLATAVLNKIVDKKSNNNNTNNNRNISESTPDLTRIREGGLTKEGSADLNENYNIENQSIISGSSIEPRSECSNSDTEAIITTNDDKSSEFILDAGRDSALSDYIAAHMVPLPNLSTVANESEEDDYMSVTSSAVGDSTWENNWLFKKKKSTVSTSLGGSSVGMLVPDPKEDVRAQIGDKTADEISDLSELGSDTDESSMDILRSSVDPINDRVFNKHIIGGQNSKIVLDELIERSSMISNTVPTDQDQLYTETLNENVEAPIRTEAINCSLTLQSNNNNNDDDQKNLEGIMPPEGFDDSSSNPLTGSIAEREYKKWYNAVEMPNNPYAPEALKRRISGGQERFIDLPKIPGSAEQSPLNMITKDKLNGEESDKRDSEIKRYSRDYYINDSCKASENVPPLETDTSKNVTTEVNNNNNKNKHHIKNNNHNNLSSESFENHKNSRTNRKYNTNECHWTLSTPVRRTSSLKYLSNRLTSPPPQTPLSSHRSTISPSPPPPLPHSRPPTNCNLNRISPSPRPSTSASYYNRFHYDHNNDDDDEDDDEIFNYDHMDNDEDDGITPERQTTPSEQVETLSPAVTQDIPLNRTTTTDTATPPDLYTATPAQVVEDLTSSLDTISQNSLLSVNTTSDDSDTIKIYNFKKQETTTLSNKDSNGKLNDVKPEEHRKEEEDKQFTPTKEGNAAIISPTRGSTPEAFKFLQPKRKLLDPSKVLSVDEEEPQTPTGSKEKPVIETEVVNSLPSVKALARAFLMTSNSMSHSMSNRPSWPRKIKTLPEGVKTPLKPIKVVEQIATAEDKSEEDATIASDLSSLETDSLSVTKQQTENTKDQPISSATTPVPVRQGVLKSNIAFFENLKNLK